MEREIGEIFEFEGVRLICLLYNNKNILEYCKDCYFFGKEQQCMQALCMYSEREDGNEVYFKEIK